MPHAEFFLYSRAPIGLPRISTRWHERVDRAAGARLPNSLWGAARVGFLARSDRVNVFWGGTGLVPLIGLEARSVLTVHDLVYSLEPQTTSIRARWAARLFFRPSVRKADYIVCNSHGSARRLEAFLGRRADAVVHPGVSDAFRRREHAEVLRVLSRLDVRKPYLLAVGTWEPRKGLQRLIAAFLGLANQILLREHTLVLAGARGWKDDAIANAVSSGGDRIRAVGYVDDDSLAALYSGADALVFPSIYEGFGIPVLEARACGTRVVASDLPELREAGGEGAIYIPPTEAGIMAGIAQALASGAPAPLAPHELGWDQRARTFVPVLTGAIGLSKREARSMARAC